MKRPAVTTNSEIFFNVCLFVAIVVIAAILLMAGVH